MRFILNICLIFILGFGLGNISVKAQKASVRANIDSTRILIGDQVNILYELEHKAGQTYNFPIFKDTLVKNVEVLSISPVDSQVLESGRVKLTQRLLITSFDTGFYVIPSQYFVNEFEFDSVKSEALPLEVFTMEVDTTKGIADIKEPFEVPLTFMEILPYLIVGLLLIGIIILLWYFWRRRQTTPEEPVQVKPSIPAHIWALQELDELAKQKLWQKGKIKLFHSRLSEIIRSYIEFRFDIPAMEQITSEIVDSFTKAKILDQEVLDNLHHALELSDLVKFAKWDPLPEENEKNMEIAYEFVYKTKKVIDLRNESKKDSTEVIKEGTKDE
jgi:hypothetical protein